MAAEACIKAILCPLGNAVINALKSIVVAQIAVLQVQVTLISATIISLQVQLIPLQAAKVAADAALAIVQSAANLIPIQLANGCLGLGLSLKDINDSFDSTVASVNKTLDEINGYLSFTAALEAKRDEINAAIFRLEALVLAIGECA